jgi:hypothetical protein
MRTVEVATPANPAAVRSDANVLLRDRCWIPFRAAREPAAKATPSLVSMVTYLFSPLNLCGGHGDPVRRFRLRCGLRRAQFPSPAEPPDWRGKCCSGSRWPRGPGGTSRGLVRRSSPYWRAPRRYTPRRAETEATPGLRCSAAQKGSSRIIPRLSSPITGADVVPGGQDRSSAA